MRDESCIFCKIIAGMIPSFKIYEDEHTLAFLDIAPFEKGHLLVLPKHHAPMLQDLPLEALQSTIAVVQKLGHHLIKTLPCDGFNVLQNNGACATQTVPHVHFHLIPRHNTTPICWIPGSYPNMDEMATYQRLLTYTE